MRRKGRVVCGGDNGDADALLRAASQGSKSEISKAANGPWLSVRGFGRA